MIAKLEEIDIKKINIHDPYDDSENIMKMDLSIDKMQPLMIRLEELNVITITEDNIILDIRNKDNIKTFFTNLDQYIVSVLHERKITKKLKIKFNYRQLISTYTGKETQYDIVSLNINFDNGEYNTEVYKSHKNKLSKTDTMNLCRDNAHTECIVELTSLIFDKSNAIIYIDNVIRQMKVKKIKPKRITKLNYSFIDTDIDTDSESESNLDNKLFDNKLPDNNKYTKTDDDRLVNNIHSNDSNDSDNSDNLDKNNSEKSDTYQDSIDNEILNHLHNETSDDSN